jgi:DNA-binding FadR family transcriptional regulator
MDAVVPLVEEALERARAVLQDPEAFAAEAVRFHDILITHCGSPVQSLVVGAMQSLGSAQIQALKRITQGLGVIDDIEQRREVLTEHVDLGALIAAGDSEAAEQLARSHFGHNERQPAFTGHGLRVHSSLLRD